MSNIAKLIEILNRARASFYHFTDTRNLPAIRHDGLVSMRRQIERGDVSNTPGGNEWSLTADKRSGMDAYVHLCFFRDHPMEWTARKEGRIVDSVFLQIAPEALAIPGTLIVDAVSNRAGVQPRPAEEMISTLDLKVIYTRTDCKDAAVQERLKTARKYEILVPGHVPIALIRNIPRG